MKLRNKKTGEIGYFCFANWDDPVLIIMDKDGVQLSKYNSLAELNEEWGDWEDHEEPKGYWFINSSGGVDFIALEDDTPEGIDGSKQIGNYFETKEEAEKARERLRAWKRLKDKGFRFERWFGRWLVGGEYNDETRADLDLLFGGEE